MKILVIEDDTEMASHLRQGLELKGHTVAIATEGECGLQLALLENFDVAVVDRMLPGFDGIFILKTLRQQCRQIPVLLLTTMGGLDDRVHGLEAGADDYLVKPFAMAELLARLNAIVRRPQAGNIQTSLRHADIEFDLLKREVRRGGLIVDLQPQELKLLEYLMRSEGRIVTKTMLLEHVWGFNFDPQTTVVETHLSRLRSKLDLDFPNPAIITQRGVGYRLAP